ncbi:MAG: hypothetical protein IV086_09215 [Hyphomonadaceae bacterium]|nr:MAG: hypothetical protein FD160_292 [Caulobacteraceae bacterium]MBT9445863.1 hypothetical protein [Hyphomonadaceae bacterium]
MISIDNHHLDDDHHRQPASAPAQDFSVPPADGDPSESHGDQITHVHSYPQFAPVASQEFSATAKLITAAVRPPQADAALSRTSVPPLRPPRTFL